MSYAEKIQANLATNDLGRDAWGRPKVVNDYSLFHSMFTYNIPSNVWKELVNGVEQTSVTNATSVDGKLILTSNGVENDDVVLCSYRNPKYEPNRGHLYSTSIFLPNKNNLSGRAFGTFTAQSGAFFALISGQLFGVVRTTVQGVTTDDSYPINVGTVDLEKGNIFDIQFQWRGVGGYKFFINLKEVLSIDYLGTRTELSSFNPANPVSYECVNLGQDAEIHGGCVDVTSEGGNDNGKTYGSIGLDTNTGEANFTGYNQPIIALRSNLLFGTVINTRDTLALLATAYADEKCIFRIWTTRDFTAITEGNGTWANYGDGHLEYIEMLETGGTLAFDTAKAGLVFTSRVPKESTLETSALFQDRTEIYLTPGDMFIFTLHRETGAATKGGVTFEFAEEI